MREEQALYYISASLLGSEAAASSSPSPAGTSIVPASEESVSTPPSTKTTDDGRRSEVGLDMGGAGRKAAFAISKTAHPPVSSTGNVTPGKFIHEESSTVSFASDDMNDVSRQNGPRSSVCLNQVAECMWTPQAARNGAMLAAFVPIVTLSATLFLATLTSASECECSIISGGFEVLPSLSHAYSFSPQRYTFAFGMIIAPWISFFVAFRTYVLFSYKTLYWSQCYGEEGGPDQLLRVKCTRSMQRWSLGLWLWLCGAQCKAWFALAAVDDSFPRMHALALISFFVATVLRDILLVFYMNAVNGGGPKTPVPWSLGLLKNVQIVFVASWILLKLDVFSIAEEHQLRKVAMMHLLEYLILFVHFCFTFFTYTLFDVVSTDMKSKAAIWSSVSWFPSFWSTSTSRQQGKRASGYGDGFEYYDGRKMESNSLLQSAISVTDNMEFLDSEDELDIPFDHLDNDDGSDVDGSADRQRAHRQGSRSRSVRGSRAGREFLHGAPHHREGADRDRGVAAMAEAVYEEEIEEIAVYEESVEELEGVADEDPADREEREERERRKKKRKALEKKSKDSEGQKRPTASEQKRPTASEQKPTADGHSGENDPPLGSAAHAGAGAGAPAGPSSGGGGTASGLSFSSLVIQHSDLFSDHGQVKPHVQQQRRNVRQRVREGDARSPATIANSAAAAASRSVVTNMVVAAPVAAALFPSALGKGQGGGATHVGYDASFDTLAPYDSYTENAGVLNSASNGQSVHTLPSSPLQQVAFGGTTASTLSPSPHPMVPASSSASSPFTLPGLLGPKMKGMFTLKGRLFGPAVGKGSDTKVAGEAKLGREDDDEEAEDEYLHLSKQLGASLKEEDDY